MTICLPLLLFYACSTDTHQAAGLKGEAKNKLEKIDKEGVIARENGQFDKAIDLHQQEIRMARQLGDTLGVVKAMNHIGTNYRRLGELDRAAQYHYMALMLTMEEDVVMEKDMLTNRVRSLNGLGNIYLSLGRLEQADSIFREALKGERQLENTLGQAINLSNIGSVKEALGQSDSAWTYYKHSLAMNRQAQSKLGEALCFCHFARLHSNEGNLTEALQEYQQAYELMADSHDDWHKLEAGVNMAELYIKQDKLQEARQLLDQQKATAERIQASEHLCKIYMLYYQLNNKEGNTKAALDNYIKSTALKDSIVNDKKKEQIHNMRLHLEKSLQEDKLSQINKQYLDERQARKTISFILIPLVLIAVGIIVGMWYMLKERTKTQRILQQMNKSKEDFFASIAIDPAEMSPADNIISDQDRQFLGHFVDIVYSQMTKGKTDVESVAEQMKLNRSQLNRRILAITGQNTLSYITQIRIAKAKRLLRADGAMPIGDIACKCGFDDVAYFSRLFKQQTNMTPSQYRKMI